MKTEHKTKTDVPQSRSTAVLGRIGSLRYKSEVRILFWEVPVARMWFTNLNDAKKSEDLLLRGVKPFWRPFCKVKWVDA